MNNKEVEEALLLLINALLASMAFADALLARARSGSGADFLGLGGDEIRFAASLDDCKEKLLALKNKLD
jgi:hypothetical protein